MPSFYNGKRFFLTYPRLDSSPHELVAFLQEKDSLAYYVVCRELHIDGTPHLHACVEFKKHQRHGVDWLDFQGKHCNKQDPRKWDACKNYVKKDGDFVESEQLDDTGVDLEQLVKASGSEIEWMKYCVEQKLQYSYARWFWDHLRGGDCTITNNDHVGIIKEPLKSYLFDNWTRKALILKGASGCGKTTWAKIHAPKPCLFVSHIDQLKKFVCGYHVSIIFDDVSFTHFPRVAQIHLLDFDNVRAIHCRHAVAHIPSGIHKIFTCNEWPVVRGDDAIERRIKCVNIE